MRKIALSLTVLGAVAVPLLHAAPAQAQNMRTWVSGAGDDANNCSRMLPWLTFAGALSKTQNRGEINCVDAGGYGPVITDKSITIDCTGSLASILAPNISGVVLTGTNVNVILRGLTINGTGGSVGLPGLAGIRFIGSGTSHVDNVNVQNFANTGAPNGRGIDFSPNNSSKLMVTDSHLVNNGDVASGGGAIVIKPAMGSVSAILSNVHAERGYHGFVADGTGGGGPINLTVERSISHGNVGDGILAKSAGVAVAVLVDQSSVTGNTTGLHADGNMNATIRIGDSRLTGNGVSSSATAGGVVQSYLSNKINGNGMDVSPPNVPGGLK